MICDLLGSTELSQRLDPEDLCVLMRHYQDAVTAAVSRYEGHVATYLATACWPISVDRKPMKIRRSGPFVLVSMPSLSWPGGRWTARGSFRLMSVSRPARS